MAAPASLTTKKRHICQLWNIPVAHLDHKLGQLKMVITNKSDSILLDYLLKHDLNVDACINHHFELQQQKKPLTDVSFNQPLSSFNKKSTISKRELLKLSKRELTKRCKKYNVSTHGSKQQMVDRILSEQRSSKRSNKTLQKMNESSAFKATLVLIEGYVHIHSSFHIYPLDVISIIAHYVKLALLRFDCVHKRYAKCIQNGGTMIKREVYFKKRRKKQNVSKDAVRSSFIVGCSIGYSFGSHQWKIKLVKPKPSDWIGIISNISLCRIKSHLDIFTDKGWSAAYMLLGGRYLRSVNSGDLAYNKKYKDHTDGYLSVWKAGDVVTLLLDCDQWRFTVFANNQRIKTIYVKPFLTYYAAIGSVNNQSQYQLISLN